MLAHQDSSLVGRIEVPYDCRACGFAGTARVHATGTDESDMRDHGRVTASMQLCPQCGQRPRGVVAYYMAGTVLGALAMIALCGVIASLMGGAWSVAMVGFGVVMSILFLRSRHRRLELVHVLVERIKPRAVAPPMRSFDEPPRTPRMLG